jgi:hypothetical protein
MADFGINPQIPLGVQGPKRTSIGEILGNATKAMEYSRLSELYPLQIQQQKNITRTSDIDLSVAEQRDKERIAVQRFLTDPRNFQTNGRIDINKLNETIPKIAPLTGRDVINNLTTLSTAQTQSDEAKTKMTTGMREIVGSRLGVLGRMGVTKKSAYTAELDLLAEQYKDNEQVRSLIDSYKTQLRAVGEDDPSLPQIAIRETQSLLKPTEQETTLAPKVSLTATGGALTPTVTTPSVGGVTPKIEASGKPIPITVGPNFLEQPTGRVDAANVPTAYRFSPDGRLLGEFPITEAPARGGAPMGGAPAAATPTVTPMAVPTPTAGPVQSQMNQALQLRRIPPGETPETMRNLQDIRSKSNEAAKGVQNQTFNSNEIIKLADQATTGRGAEMLANLSGGYAAIPFGGDMATNLQQLGHYMSLQTQSLSSSSGMNTDAGRAIAAEASGTTRWTPEAIKSTARVNRALALATQMYNNGLESAIAKSNGDIFAARKYTNDWSNKLDIKALKLYDAFVNQDTEGLAQSARELGGKDSAAYKKAKTKIDELKRMAGME